MAIKCVFYYKTIVNFVELLHMSEIEFCIKFKKDEVERDFT